MFGLFKKRQVEAEDDGWFPRAEIIYSRRYTDYSSPKLLKDMGREDKGIPATSKRETMASFDEFMRKLRDESEYVERPDGMKRVQEFIGRVKRLSADFEVDVDVKQWHGHVEAELYCFGLYFSDFTPEFCTLLSLCDTISVMPTPKRKGYVTISLTCHSHDHYVSGRKQTY